MAKPGYNRSNTQIFLDEMNEAFEGFNFEVDRDKSLWVNSYPTQFVIDESKTLESNIKEALEQVRSLLIISI